MDAPLAFLLQGMYDDINSLIAVRDRFTPAKLEKEFGRIIVERHLSAYFAGSGLTDLSARADRELGAVIQRELDYMRAFLGQIDRLSDAQAAARALQYTGAIKGSYERGKHWLWDLPFQPTEGSECQNNCRCRWQVDVLDLEELDADATWVRSGSEHCPTCDARATDNPYRFRGGVLV